MSESRALAIAVMKPDWRMPKPEDMDRAMIERAVSEIEAQQPLKTIEPDGVAPDEGSPLGFRFTGEWKVLSDALRPIGAKISPTLKPGEIGAWMAAILMALSDLPPRIILIAMRKTMHKPMRFLNEVETAIREFADEALENQKNALFRLKRMIEEIERAANPPPMIEEKPKVWTQQEIDDCNARFRALGFTLRWKMGEVEGECVDDEEAMAEVAARKRDAKKEDRREKHARDIDARDNTA